MGKAVPPLPSSPIPLPFPSLFHSSFSPSPLEVGPLNQLEGLGSAVSSPRRKTNLEHSKAARKPLVAIILNTMSTMFCVSEEINWRCYRHNTVGLRCHISGVYTGSAPSKSTAAITVLFRPLVWIQSNCCLIGLGLYIPSHTFRNLYNIPKIATL